MPACQARNFDISILGAQSPYTVVAEFNGATGDGLFYHDATQDDWAETIRVLGVSQLAPGESFILNIGALLFNELMQEGIRDLWVEARSTVQRGEYLRVRLNLRAPAVAALPWETLADTRRRSLAADKSLALVRTATDVVAVERPRPLQTALPAKILIVAAEESDGIDPAEEIQRIQAILAPLIPDRLRVEVLYGRFDIHALHSRLDESRPDILHIISHGEQNGIYLWEDDEPALVKASQLVAVLAQVESVKVVFLNACLAGQPDDATPFADLAQRLLQSGIPAVIAMQFEVLDRAAAAFAGHLYEALIGGPCPGAIDIATSIARSRLYIHDPDRVDYATPLLWLNSPNGVVLHLDTPAVRADAQPVPLPTPTPPPALDFALEEKERWFAALPQTVAPVALRFDYAERRKQIGKVLVSLRQDAAAQQASSPIDNRRAGERLEIFQTERQFIDDLLARLERSDGTGQ